MASSEQHSPHSKKRYYDLGAAHQKLAKSLDTIARTYRKTEQKGPFWRNKFFWSFILALVAVWGYWLNWQSDLTNIEVNRLEKQKAIKLQLQQTINEVVMQARALVLNQIEGCQIEHPNAVEMKIARNNVLIKLIAVGTGSRYTFNNAVQDKMNQIISNVDNIKDVCKLNADKFDGKQREKFKELTNLIGASVDEDNRMLATLEHS